jgi:hypothetical protein
MYLAPLNYDRFFKRVFSHEHIAKRFLEDFLNVTITDSEKYHKWFRFVEKTRYKENESADFDEFKKDEVFLDIMRLISKEEMNSEDLKYLESEELSLEEIERYNEGVRNEGRKEGEKIGEKRGERKGEKKGRRAQAEFIATQMIKAGESDDKIMLYTELQLGTV